MIATLSPRRARCTSRQLCDTFSWPSVNQRKFGARESSSGTVKGCCQSISACGQIRPKAHVVARRLVVHALQFGGLERGVFRKRFGGRKYAVLLQDRLDVFLRHGHSPVLGSGGDAAHLLPQNIPESMGVKKGVEPAAILRPRLQIVERRLDRHVAYDAGQTAGKVGGFLVSQ